MIQLFHIPNHKIDTSNFSHSLHDKSVEELEKKIADYVGAKYACAVNSATNAIFLIMRDKRQNSRSRMVVDLPSMIPPVVANAILTSGFHNEINFVDDILWMGNSYVLHKFDDYKVIDSAQKLEKNQFQEECNDEDLMVFSFYPTKPLGGLDGGMIVTNDKKKYKYYKSAVLNGMSYSDNNWDRKIAFPGFKMYLSSFQAEFILRNFENFEKKQMSLRRMRNIYNKELGYANTSTHLYVIHVTNNKSFLRKLKDNDITAGIHYPPLHINKIYTQGRKFNCAYSEKYKDVVATLPMNEKLSDLDLEKIIEKVKLFK